MASYLWDGRGASGIVVSQMAEASREGISGIHDALHPIGVCGGMVSGVRLGREMVGLQRHAVSSAWQDMPFEQSVVWLRRDASGVGGQPSLCFSVSAGSGEMQSADQPVCDRIVCGGCGVQRHMASCWSGGHLSVR